jgi:5-(carboxyamino)imidazole ribonucleotide synthase
MPAVDDVLAVRGAHLHDYHKGPRPGRKLGHITVCETDAGDEFRGAVEKVAKLARI